VKRREIIYLCNALDDATKAERRITTDSPAATNKVFGLCRALQNTGAEVAVLSMGRGRQRGSFKCFLGKEYVQGNIKIHYASFWDVPLLTHLVTACSLVVRLLRLKSDESVLIASTREWH